MTTLIIIAKFIVGFAVLGYIHHCFNGTDMPEGTEIVTDYRENPNALGNNL